MQRNVTFDFDEIQILEDEEFKEFLIQIFEEDLKIAVERLKKQDTFTVIRDVVCGYYEGDWDEAVQRILNKWNIDGLMRVTLIGKSPCMCFKPNFFAKKGKDPDCDNLSCWDWCRPWRYKTKRENP